MKYKNCVKYGMLLFTIGIMIYSSQLSAQSFTGRSEAYNYATISATVPGRISKINHNVGSHIKKGQLILHIEKDVEELEANRRKIISESKIELKAAEYQISIFKKDYEATKSLFDSLGSVSEEELWKKELEYKRAIAEHDRLEMLEKQEEMEYKIAAAQLRKKNIYAPFSGEVVQVHLREGESCNAQEPLVRIVNIEKCRFIAHIEAAAAENLVENQSVNLSFRGSGKSVERKGEVEYIAPVVDPSSGLLEVRVVFDNSDRKIRPGILGKMTIPQKATAAQ